MTNSQLIAFLLLLGAQATPILVADLANLIKGNPKMDGETDEAYRLRLVAQIDATDDQVQKKNQQIQE